MKLEGLKNVFRTAFGDVEEGTEKRLVETTEKLAESWYVNGESEGFMAGYFEGGMYTSMLFAGIGILGSVVFYYYKKKQVG